MSVVSLRMKSSAVSVWIFPGLEGRDSVPIFPSGSPVEKEKDPAEAWLTNRNKALKVEARARAAAFAAFVLTEKVFPAVRVWRFNW